MGAETPPTKTRFCRRWCHVIASEADAVEDFELSSGGVQAVEGDGGRGVILNAAGSLAGAGGGEDSEGGGDDRDGGGVALEVVINHAEADGPRGAFEGMTALIWPGLKKTGIAATVVVPWVTEIKPNL
jgi:hypothetical protein